MKLETPLENRELIRGEPYMAVAKVVPLFNQYNEQKGYEIESIIKIDRSKKKEQKEREEAVEDLTSYVEGEQLL